jgi:hypothetical protein
VHDADKWASYWKEIAGALAVGGILWRLAAWFFGLTARMAALERWSALADERFDKGGEQIQQTHDAVTSLLTEMRIAKGTHAHIVEKLDALPCLQPRPPGCESPTGGEP